MPPFAIIWWLRKNYNTLKPYWSAEAETRSVTSGKTDQLLAECVVRWAGICSKRASERLLESSTKYLEERLKLTVNREKSRTVSVFAIRNFKFLGFALGRNGKGIYVRVHTKSWKKFKSRLKELSSRKRCQSIKPSLGKIKVYARGWLNYYGIASMKNNIDDVNGWLYHRIRMCIWKQWKLPRTKKRNLIKMGIHEYYANMAANCRRGHWYCANLTTVKKAMTKERLINSGFYDLATAYQSVHVNYWNRRVPNGTPDCLTIQKFSLM